MSGAVVFVCAGNTCRSPAAAALFARRVGDQQDWWIESAGVRAARGAPASAELAGLLDPARQRSKPLEDVPMEQFDLVVTMEQEHKQAVLGRFPGLAGRVWTLGELAGSVEEVDDPFGGGAGEYARMVECLERLLDAALGEILRRAAGGSS